MNVFDVYRIAEKIHDGHLDHAGKPYIGHLVRVYLRVVQYGGDDFQQMAALLHDAIEDGRATAEWLLEQGVPVEALTLVQDLTKPKGAVYLEYVAGLPIRAKLVKKADVSDNKDPLRLCLLEPDVAARLSTKYELASEILDEALCGPEADLDKFMREKMFLP